MWEKAEACERKGNSGEKTELWDRLGIMRKTGNCGRELENCWKEQRIVHEKGIVEVTRNCRSDRETAGGALGHCERKKNCEKEKNRQL